MRGYLSMAKLGVRNQTSKGQFIWFMSCLLLLLIAVDIWNHVWDSMYMKDPEQVNR